MRVQELFPLALASFDQGLRRGEGKDELPGEGVGPILKGLQSRRVIFRQSLLELVNQGGALLDQDYLVAA